MVRPQLCTGLERRTRYAVQQCCARARSMMLLPLMVADRKGERVKNKLPLWLGTQVTGLLCSGSALACNPAAG